MGDDLPFVDLGTNRTVLSVKAGGERTCAILDDGSLKCWGDNQGGQLGLGDTAPRGGAPSQMGDDLPAVSLGTGRTAVPLAGAALALPTEAPTGECPGFPLPRVSDKILQLWPFRVHDTAFSSCSRPCCLEPVIFSSRFST